MCRTCGSTAWCMRASCGRRATARACRTSMRALSRRCRASSRWCATATSWRSSPRANSRRCSAMRALAAAAQWDETADAARRDRPLRRCCKACEREVGIVAEAGSADVTRRQGLRGDVHPALSDPWLDRPVLRRRPDGGRGADRLVAYAGRLSRSRGDRRDARAAAGARCAASIWRARAATATTAPTTPPPTPR